LALAPANLLIMMKLNLLKENSMVKEQTTLVKKQTPLQAFRKSFLVALALAAFLAACTAQPNLQQVQSLVQTSVASTMQAQNQVGTFVAQTVQAQQPTATDTPTIMLTASPFPTLTPVIPVIATSTLSSGGGGGGGGGGAPAPLAYSCGQEDWRPLDYTVFAPGDHFIVKWTLLNNGTQRWCAGSSCSGGPDLTFQSGTNFLAAALGTGPIQAISLKPGQTEAFGPYGGIAPSKSGTYAMYWKLEDMQNSECLQFIIVVK
jgi:hypothetical protein